MFATAPFLQSPPCPYAKYNFGKCLMQSMTVVVPLDRLLKDVGTACLEANDTVKYLKPLRKYLEKLNSMDDFVALIELFKPMFHTVLLIWKHSGYYNTSAKMVTLLREMCNDLIMQACKFAPGQPTHQACWHSCVAVYSLYECLVSYCIMLWHSCQFTKHAKYE